GFGPYEGPVPDVRASMIYTSGTTGKPKGVLRNPATPEFIVRRDQILREIWGLEAGVRAALTGPIYHSAPNAYAMGVLVQQGLLVLQPRFEAEPLLALIQEHRISHMHMVPTMFVRLLRLPESVRARYDLSSLRLVIHGAAPCPPAVKRAMIEWWGPVIHEYYGSTELGMLTTTNSREWLERPGTVGRPTRYARVQVLDDQGRPAPAGVPGLIYARNDGLTDFTYYGAPAKRRDMERDGLMTNGDIGYLDADGYLYLCDRKIDMVISGGVNIYPAEIESVLVQMPGVQDCAVFGIPDEEYGEALLAVVQPAPHSHLDAAGVQDFLRPHLAHYKIPHRVEFAQNLPREDSGKIFKRKLREPYWAGRSLRI
ncbi:MAG TPA: AMP-binding protein, partial [bacterium]|nr:AMP-binding protein [bacterium]